LKSVNFTAFLPIEDNAFESVVTLEASGNSNPRPLHAFVADCIVNWSQHIDDQACS